MIRKSRSDKFQAATLWLAFPVEIDASAQVSGSIRGTRRKSHVTEQAVRPRPLQPNEAGRLSPRLLKYFHFFPKN
jgi:hypothetical protein